ncbi:MAG: TetR/AcrR family transcriptional regulator [Oscillospiraceae bacterium]
MEFIESVKTKQRILDYSLQLFSCDGFSGVSMRNIAAAVGVKESSLYKHFQSKQAIFDAILLQMNESIKLAMAGLADKNDNPHEGSIITGEELTWMCTGLYMYFLQDESVAAFRRMLTLEQYKSPKAAEIFKSQFFDMPIAYYANIFNVLLARGIIPYADAQFLALEFYSPVFFLLCRGDTDKEYRKASLKILEEHVNAFYKQYCKKQDK